MKQAKAGNGVNRAGFTLLEILLAIFIFGIIASVIFASYTGSSSIVNDTESQAEIYQKARIAMERILEDLESAYYRPPPVDENTADRAPIFLGEDKTIKAASADTLRFVSTSHLIFSDEEKTAGQTVIEYTVKENDSGDGLALFRADTPTLFYSPALEGEGSVLCDDLRSVDFKYYDAGGRKYDSWDDTAEEYGGLPAMVTVVLEFIDKKEAEKGLEFMVSVIPPMGGSSGEQP